MLEAMTCDGRPTLNYTWGFSNSMIDATSQLCRRYGTIALIVRLLIVKKVIVKKATISWQNFISTLKTPPSP